MNCIITLKINDYIPKLQSIPYENFKCAFINNDFTGNILLNKSSLYFDLTKILQIWINRSNNKLSNSFFCCSVTTIFLIFNSCIRY